MGERINTNILLAGEGNFRRKPTGTWNKKGQDNDKIDLREERCTCEKRMQKFRTVSNNGNEFVSYITMLSAPRLYSVDGRIINEYGADDGIRIGRGN
jgi:hypothetical protein